MANKPQHDASKERSSRNFLAPYSTNCCFFFFLSPIQGQWHSYRRGRMSTHSFLRSRFSRRSVIVATTLSLCFHFVLVAAVGGAPVPDRLAFCLLPEEINQSTVFVNNCHWNDSTTSLLVELAEEKMKTTVPPPLELVLTLENVFVNVSRLLRLSGVDNSFVFKLVQVMLANCNVTLHDGRDDGGYLIRLDDGAARHMSLTIVNTTVLHPMWSRGGTSFGAGWAPGALLSVTGSCAVHVYLEKGFVAGITQDASSLVTIAALKLNACASAYSGIADINVTIVATMINLTAVSAANRLIAPYLFQHVLQVESSHLGTTGNLFVRSSHMRIASAVKAVMFYFVSNVELIGWRVLIESSSVHVASVGDTIRDILDQPRGSTFLSFHGSLLSDSFIHITNSSATLTTSLGVVNQQSSAASGAAYWTDIVLVYLYSSRNCMVEIHDVFVAGVVGGGDISMSALSMMSASTVQFAVVVVSMQSDSFSNVTVSLQRVAFDTYVAATAAALGILNRVFVQFAFLVALAASCSDVRIFVNHSQLARWSGFPSMRLPLDARLQAVVSIAKGSSFGAAPAALAAARVMLHIRNVTVAFNERERRHVSLVVLSGNHSGSDISASGCYALQLPDSTPSQMQHLLGNDVFPLVAREDLLLLPHGALKSLNSGVLWAKLLLTDAVLLQNNTKVRFKTCRTSSLLVSPMYSSDTGLTSALLGFFPKGSLRVNATLLTWTDCVLRADERTASTPSPSQHNAMICGLQGMSTALHVQLTNVTFLGFNEEANLNLFNDTELQRGGKGASCWNCSLDLSCNYRRCGEASNGRTCDEDAVGRYVVEASVVASRVFAVTYAHECPRMPSPQFSLTATRPVAVPEPAPEEQALKSSHTSASAASTAVVSVMSAFAGDIVAVGLVQALASFAIAGTCSRGESDAAAAASANERQPSRFTLSPFVDVGLVAVVFGNVGIIAAGFVAALAVSLVLELRGIGTATRHASHSSRFMKCWRAVRSAAFWQRTSLPSHTLRVALFFLPGVLHGTVGLAAASEASPTSVAATVFGLVCILSAVGGLLKAQRMISLVVVFRPFDFRKLQRRAPPLLTANRLVCLAVFPVAVCRPERVFQSFAAFLGGARSVSHIRPAFAPKLVSFISVGVLGVPALRSTTASCAAVWFALSTLYIGVAVYYVMKTPLMCRIQCYCGAISTAVMGLSAFVRGILVVLGPDIRVDVESMNTAASWIMTATSLVGVAHAMWLRSVMSPSANTTRKANQDTTNQDTQQRKHDDNRMRLMHPRRQTLETASEQSRTASLQSGGRSSDRDALNTSQVSMCTSSWDGTPTNCSRVSTSPVATAFHCTPTADHCRAAALEGLVTAVCSLHRRAPNPNSSAISSHGPIPSEDLC